MENKSRIDRYVENSRTLNGQPLPGGKRWNSVASADSIRHFAYGISDDNPLWLDERYAANSAHGSRLAPPAFLTSVLYPISYGDRMNVSLASLIGELEYQWFRPIRLGDQLSAGAAQTDVVDSVDRIGQRSIHIITQSTYFNQRGETIAQASGNVARVEQSRAGQWLERSAPDYNTAQIEAFQQAYRDEVRTGDRGHDLDRLQVGDALPAFQRGPLTVGDLVSWHAASGPSWRGGRLGYLDTLRAPESTVTLPGIGWPVLKSQQHEDMNLNRMRGMPAPFDNGVMRFSWLSVMFTNWIGDSGQLNRLKVRLEAPFFYGDVATYQARIDSIDRMDDQANLELVFSGTNQHGETLTTGSASVTLARQQPVRHRVSAPGAAISADDIERPESFTPVHQHIENWAAQQASSTALHFEENRLSWSDLEQQVNRQAHFLMAQDLPEHSVIAVCFKRGFEMVTWILAILKAGHTFLPLDPELPEARMEFMLCDSQSGLLLSHSDPSTAARPERIIRIDPQEHQALIAGQPGSPPTRSTQPSDSAYLLYTSGSTAEPKGVLVPHGSLSTYLSAMRDALAIEPDDIYTHSLSFSFSAGMRQLFLPLSGGAAILIATERQQRDTLDLFRQIKSCRATIWDTVPTLWQHSIDIILGLDPARRTDLLDNDLRLVTATGEPLYWKMVQTWARELEHPARMINLYSQTETCGTVCMFPIDALDGDPDAIVPLGHPVKYTRVLLLDGQQNPVRPGQIGEICVGGPRLASGYLSEPKLNKQNFIPDPDGRDFGGRLYRSGDRGRMRPDGLLESLGRQDRRVKVRGFRVEPSEVEGVLRGHPNLREAAVYAHQDQARAGEQQLVGCLVADPQPTIPELRRYLGLKLPDYMIPSHFIFVEQLPRMTSGKIDRSQLPEPALPSLSQVAVDPDLSEIERRLTAIWCDVLGRSSIGPDENFFEIGGHSLTAMRLLARVEQAFNARLSLVDLLQHVTLRAQATLFGSAGGSQPATILVPLQPRGSQPAIFCIHGLTGDVLWYARLAAELAPDQPFYGVQAPGLDGHSEAMLTIEAIAACYVEQIRRQQPDGPYLIGGASFGGTVALEVAQQLLGQGQQVSRLVIFDHVLFSQRRQAKRIGDVPGYVLRFSKNVPRWLAEMGAIGPGPFVKRIRRKTGSTGKIIWSWLRGIDPQTVRNVGDMVDYSAELPEHRKQLIETNSRAIHQYQPQPYLARVLLVKARTRPLLGLLDPADGWHELASGNVDVVQVNGSHEGMFKPPHVSELAAMLKRALDGGR
jgi:amino acid adenylation domain-containing protein